jgi:Zn-dependent membrane protease YugP
MPFGFLLDPLYLVCTGLGLALTLWAQWKVKSTFHRYQQERVLSGMTGAQAAAAVCRAAGVSGVTIEEHPGMLSDHYDPRAKTLRLSPAVYHGSSISSVAVAAHEAGHAIQDARAYPALGFRSKLVPLTNIGARLYMLPFMIGIFLASGSKTQNHVGVLLMQVGIVCFAAVVLFQLVTLPVEIDASRRARDVLAKAGIVRSAGEAAGVAKVLNAAAMTYVASALSGALQLVFLILRAQSASRRE